MTNKTDLSSQSTQFRRQLCKKGLISEKLKYLAEFQSIILHLDAAVCLVTIMKNLKLFTDGPENNIVLSKQQHNIILLQSTLKFFHFYESLLILLYFFFYEGDTCWNFLTRQWYSMTGVEENGPKYNDQITFLLEIYLQCHDDKLENLVKMVDWMEEEVLVMESKNDRLKTLPTIHK